MSNQCYIYGILFILTGLLFSCSGTNKNQDQLDHLYSTRPVSEILGNPDYQAICYGGYRDVTRDSQPTLLQIKNDMKILSAMGIKVLRTYNTHFDQAANLLRVIRELKTEDPHFEMYVMLGAWIDCENAWTDQVPNHDAEDLEKNTAEITRAIALANKYEDIVKVIAVGNEAMVKWAAHYYVQPDVILKWVNYLQDHKQEGKLNKEVWITSSDNFASWGGGDSSYHCDDLNELIKRVDFVSLHTYPMHDTHYNPVFWGSFESEQHLPKAKAVELAMKRALRYAKNQYARTVKYVHSIDSTKPVHIGETGWASLATGHYGPHGSKACDEYKEGVYYKLIRKWTKKEGITCFYFEAFDERWKDPHNPKGSENHFGLFKINGEAKYAVWDQVDEEVFVGLTRNGNAIRKTYKGDLDALLEEVEIPPVKHLKE